MASSRSTFDFCKNPLTPPLPSPSDPLCPALPRLPPRALTHSSFSALLFTLAVTENFTFPRANSDLS